MTHHRSSQINPAPAQRDPQSLSELTTFFSQLQLLQNFADARAVESISRWIDSCTSTLPDLIVEIPQKRKDSVEWQSLVSKFEVTIIRKGAIFFSLPQGESFLDLLAAATEVSLYLDQRSVVSHERVIKILDDPKFSNPADANMTIAIEGCAIGSLNKSRSVQRNYLKQPLAPETKVMAAAALYFAITGEDIFAGNYSRTFSGTVRMTSEGLDFSMPRGGDEASQTVGAAIEIPINEAWLKRTGG